MRKTKAKNPKRPAADDAASDAPAGDEVVAPADDVAPEKGAEAKPEIEIDPVEALEQKVAALEDNLLRARAETQNIQRRATIDKSNAIQYANERLMQSLLGVLDDFDRSMAAADGGDDSAAVVDGVRLVHANLVKALGEHGLEGIDALHKPFDPHVHEAMLQQPSEEHPAGTVVEEVAKGYRLRDRVIRPTKVIVSKAVDAEAPDEGAQVDEQA